MQRWRPHYETVVGVAGQFASLLSPSRMAASLLVSSLAELCLLLAVRLVWEVSHLGLPLMC